MLMRLYVVNVGVNTADARIHGLRSPRFADGSFEVITITEPAKFVGCSGIPTYEEVRCWTGEGTVARFVPEAYHGYPTHLDPEFETFTYGDIKTSRASNLSRVETGDQLWFLARLWDHSGDEWLNRSEFYFIGLFVVEHNLTFEPDATASSLDRDVRERIQHNAHYLRLLQGDRSEFRVLCGDRKRSRRFQRALLVSPEVAGYIYGGEWRRTRDYYVREGTVLVSKNGQPRSYARFGSVTRTVQAFLDSENRNDEPYLQALSAAAAECF